MGKYRIIIMTTIFLVAMAMVIRGLRLPSYKGVAVMLLGIIGIVADLYLYNRRYAK